MLNFHRDKQATSICSFNNKETDCILIVFDECFDSKYSGKYNFVSHCKEGRIYSGEQKQLSLATALNLVESEDRIIDPNEKSNTFMMLEKSSYTEDNGVVFSDSGSPVILTENGILISKSMIYNKNNKEYTLFQKVFEEKGCIHRVFEMKSRDSEKIELEVICDNFSELEVLNKNAGTEIYIKYKNDKMPTY